MAVATNRNSRRTAMILGATGLASAGLFGVKSAFAINPLDIIPDYANVTPRTVMITGANTGIGRAAAEQLCTAGHSVIVVCRTIVKAQKTIEEIKATFGDKVTGNLIPLECDVSDLDSVRRLVRDFRDLNLPLNVLVANAGISLNAQEKGDEFTQRSKDGFELTIATNYLGHFLLTNLLLPDLEKSGSDSRIVITGSEVHDPSSPGGSVGPGATLGDLSGLKSKAPMVDGGPYDADKAYKDSNHVFMLELQRRLKAKGVTVTANSFGPGLITRSAFFKNQNGLFSRLFDFATNDIFHVAETVDFGGACLSYMALSKDLEGKGGLWLNAVQPGKPVFEQLQPSIEARDTKKAKMLYDMSLEAVGLA
uniref:Chloroplast light-dependent protochlorophyllide reductase n=1 Tax=Gymnochlora stellata TaxID=67809 RepID=B5A4I3_GYMST|nr:chloroplast light-dependent protochlorophyllide reductase [Gymnochlora stellata]